MYGWIQRVHRDAKFCRHSNNKRRICLAREKSHSFTFDPHCTDEAVERVFIQAGRDAKRSDELVDGMPRAVTDVWYVVHA